MPDTGHIHPQSRYAVTDAGLSRDDIGQALESSLAPLRGSLRKVLLIPPDFTRFHSNAGLITQLLYEMLFPACQVDTYPGEQDRVANHVWRDSL
jgi:hypothetical protein